MPELPDISNACTARLEYGFLATPLADTPAGHAEFQKSVKSFATQSRRWELMRTHSGRYECWDKAFFIVAETCQPQ